MQRRYRVRGLHLQHVLLDLLSLSFSRPLLRNPTFVSLQLSTNLECRQSVTGV